MKTIFFLPYTYVKFVVSTFYVQNAIAGAIWISAYPEFLCFFCIKFNIEREMRINA